MNDKMKEFLRHYRMFCDETLVEMADKIGISVVELSNIENGKIKATKDFEEKFLKAYKLNEMQKGYFRCLIEKNEIQGIDKKMRMANICWSE